jgi:multiple sugar transport system substrate-binding protein
MLTLEISTFFGDFEELDGLARLLETFNQQERVSVKSKRMHWMTSWSDLVSVASLGSGPDISQVGNTWVSSLTGLNAIRTFKPAEIDAMGGALLFPNAEISGPAWAVPWTSYTFVICYRKDWLEGQGLDPQTAFTSSPATLATIRALGHASQKGAWLTPLVPSPYPDLLHIAASWIWGFGGDLVSMRNNHPQVVFDQPNALEGLAAWLESYRLVPPSHRLSARDCINLFQQGKAGAVVAGIRAASAMIANLDPGLRAQVGFAPVSPTPWVGGDSLVIWKHAQREAEREQHALALVAHLTSRENVLQFCQAAHSLPARQDALDLLYPEGHPLREAVQTTSQRGRCYPALNQWRSIEHHLVQCLDTIVHEAYNNPGRDSLEILEKHLHPLAERLNRSM